MVNGNPVGFELVIGRAEDDPPAVATPHVVEFVPANSHICIVSVRHRLWPIGTRSCLCGAHRSFGFSLTLVIDMPFGTRPR